MTRFEKIKSMTIDEFAEWLDKYGAFDNEVPWMDWWDKTYCQNCESVMAHVLYFNDDKEYECSWCELNGYCKFFQDMDDIPDIKQIIKLWLESEVGNEKSDFSN